MLGSMRKKRAESARPGAMAESSGIEEGVDLENGIIVVDDSPPERTIATSEILRRGDDNPSKPGKPGAGKVFILDLGPIFETLGVAPKDRAGHNLGRFCDNILARSVARLGTYEAKGSDLFLFRLNMDDDRALRAAIAIVNEAGNYFLRDGFQAEDLVPQMVDAVDAAEATGPDGGIDVEKALDARSRRRRAAEDKRLAKAANVLAPPETAPETGLKTEPRPIFEQKSEPARLAEPEWIAVNGTARHARQARAGTARQDAKAHCRARPPANSPWPAPVR